jgi:hypothetical protein
VGVVFEKSAYFLEKVGVAVSKVGVVGRKIRKKGAWSGKIS